MSKNKYYLANIHYKKDARLLEMCRVASIICLYHFNRGVGKTLLQNESLIRKYWTLDKVPPSANWMARCINVKNVKWYINKKLKYEPIDGWTPDFLNGMANCGKLLNNKKVFPTLIWSTQNHILEIFKSSVFSGTFSVRKRSERFFFTRVPAFYLPYDDKSHAYIAGILATGKIVYVKGVCYVRYSKCMFKIIHKLGIPIEVKCKLIFYISPIWPALFSVHMPNILKDRWFNLKNAVGVLQYAPILWKMHTNVDFIKGGLPYLKSRRSVFYDNKNDEGAMEYLSNFMNQKQLMLLDTRITNCISEWIKISIENKKEEIKQVKQIRTRSINKQE